MTRQRPFLKWAGNKYRLLPSLLSILDQQKGSLRLVEPFVGSGAVFLNTHYPAYLLADSNPDLIQLYQTLQQEGAGFIDFCASFFTPLNNTAERFYTLRESFNTTLEPSLKSALFLYLNRHGFNGLCRYNQQGQFNVPFGRYEKPYFPREEMQAFYQHAQQAVFCCQPFALTFAALQPGDIVYCDPPYVPLSATANFTTYSSGGFSTQDQIHLAQLAKRTAEEEDIAVLLSNHATEETKALYAHSKTTLVMVPRTISANKLTRQPVQEILALFQPSSQKSGLNTHQRLSLETDLLAGCNAII